MSERNACRLSEQDGRIERWQKEVEEKVVDQELTKWLISSIRLGATSEDDAPPIAGVAPPSSEPTKIKLYSRNALRWPNSTI